MELTGPVQEARLCWHKRIFRHCVSTIGSPIPTALTYILQAEERDRQIRLFQLAAKSIYSPHSISD